jgi:hypothetical protein
MRGSERPWWIPILVGSVAAAYGEPPREDGPIIGLTALPTTDATGPMASTTGTTADGVDGVDTDVSYGYPGGSGLEIISEPPPPPAG